MVNTLNSATTSLGDSTKDCFLAAIDIGTNSIHMVVVKIDPQLKAFSIVTALKDTVRLGDRDLVTGNLTPEAIKRAMASLQRCKDLAASFNVTEIVAVATSATREAANGKEFIHQIESEIGIRVDLISGQEEARRIYLGVLSGIDFNFHSHVIIDIGGGSTELILADSHESRFLSSTKVGAVRLTREFITSDPITEKDLVYLKAFIHGALEPEVDRLKSHLSSNEPLILVGTSGTIETLAEIIAIEKEGCAPKSLNGYQISLKDLKDLVKRLTSMSYEERFNLPGMSDKRAEIIVAGGLILQEAMIMLNLSYITVCERALREGIIVDWMLKNGLIEDRLRYQSEVRPRSVMKIAHKYQVELDYSQRIADIALSIFDQTKGILHNWGNRERELFWAAAILHDCGLYISHSAHHKHSYYLIRNAELLGFSEIELEIIANLARYHRKSKPKKKHENFNNLSSHDRKIVKQLSAILRLSVSLNKRKFKAIKELQCKYDPEYKKVHFLLIPSLPNDDCALELWDFNYKKEIFENEYNVKVMISLASYSDNN